MSISRLLRALGYKYIPTPVKRVLHVLYASGTLCALCALCVCVYAYIIREQFTGAEPPSDQWVVKNSFGSSYRNLAPFEMVSRPELAVTIL